MNLTSVMELVLKTWAIISSRVWFGEGAEQSQSWRTGCPLRLPTVIVVCAEARNHYLATEEDTEPKNPVPAVSGSALFPRRCPQTQLLNLVLMITRLEGWTPSGSCCVSPQLDIVTPQTTTPLPVSTATLQLYALYSTHIHPISGFSQASTASFFWHLFIPTKNCNSSNSLSPTFDIPLPTLSDFDATNAGNGS